MMVYEPAYVGIGSNLQDPRAQVLAAFDALARLPQTRLVARSSLYATPPFGPVAQGDFVNAVAGLLTQLSAQQLLNELRAIETAQGRQPERRWGPRIIDLDLLVYGAAQIDEPGLTVPHRGIAERNFVLYPLADIAPDLHVPGLGRVSELKSRVSSQNIAALA